MSLIRSLVAMKLLLNFLPLLPLTILTETKSIREENREKGIFPTFIENSEGFETQDDSENNLILPKDIKRIKLEWNKKGGRGLHPTSKKVESEKLSTRKDKSGMLEKVEEVEKDKTSPSEMWGLPEMAKIARALDQEMEAISNSWENLLPDILACYASLSGNL